MQPDSIIYNARIVTPDCVMLGCVEITDGIISKIHHDCVVESDYGCDVDKYDAGGMLLMPGVVDDHVHFRDPGLTHKADIYTESLAAIAGGVTTCFDMPNCKPPTVTLQALNDKFERAKQALAVNYSFYIGATDSNFNEIASADYTKVCGIKLFLGSSTGGMLVENNTVIDRLLRFSRDTNVVIAVHAEDETIIKSNIAKFRAEYGENLPVEFHPQIRNVEACYSATARIVEAAARIGARVHVMHVTTERELSLFSDAPLSVDKNITAEACVAHLMFSDEDYARLGTRIKCNPAVKTIADRDALRAALNTGKIDVIATDHAPHLLAEKQGNCLTAASGMPMVQFSLPVMLDLVADGVLSVHRLAKLMSANPATLFGLRMRGEIKVGDAADLTLVANESNTIYDASVVSRCGWTPLEGYTSRHKVKATWVNGRLSFNNDTFANNLFSYAQQATFR